MQADQIEKQLGQQQQEADAADDQAQQLEGKADDKVRYPASGDRQLVPAPWIVQQMVTSSGSVSMFQVL